VLATVIQVGAKWSEKNCSAVVMVAWMKPTSEISRGAVGLCQARADYGLHDVRLPAVAAEVVDVAAVVVEGVIVACALVRSFVSFSCCIL